MSGLRTLPRRNEQRESAYTRMRGGFDDGTAPMEGKWWRLDDVESEIATAEIEADEEFHATVVRRLNGPRKVISIEEALRYARDDED